MVVRNNSSAARGSSNVNQDDAMLKLLLHTTMPDMEMAASLGYRAFCNGKDIGDNPFDEGSSEFHAWEDSWWFCFYNPDINFDKEQIQTTTSV